MPVIDTAWNPLADGCPPQWASAWGEDRLGVFVEFTLGEVTQRLRWIPPGRFLMGSLDAETQGLATDAEEREWFAREHPQHLVYLTQGFWLFDTPCTQALWEAVMGDNPSRFQSHDRPVEQVSWEDVQRFLEQINAHVPGLALVLPTEAQWEHACRAGIESALYTGHIEILGDANAPALDPIAWYGGNSNQGFELDDGQERSWLDQKQYPGGNAGTHPVKGKRPNPWGLYDMLGDVWEWCADGLRRYGEDHLIDPVGLQYAGGDRVVRGGSWGSGARYCRCAYRRGRASRDRDYNLGFRAARVQV